MVHITLSILYGPYYKSIFKFAYVATSPIPEEFLLWIFQKNFSRKSFSKVFRVESFDCFDFEFFSATKIESL